MKRAMATFGTGPHEELLEIALPSFERFADIHGYDLFTDAPEPSGRPASWDKLIVINALLEEDYHEVLWIGADLVIVDDSADIAVPMTAWQAMAIHVTDDGVVPNCDFWLVRKPMQPILAAAWAQTRRIHAPWWEQTAILSLMGANVDVRPITWDPTPLYEHTHFLNPIWNWHVNDTSKVGDPRIRHATMLPDRAAAMREWAAA